MRTRFKNWFSTMAGFTLVTAFASTAAGQTPPAAPPDPNPGGFTLTGSFDAVSTYMFRGIRQHSTGMAFWPVADVGVALYSGEDALKSAAVNVGLWNSLHTGDTGTDGPSGKLWYESDFYTTLSLGFGGGTSLATTYTALTSPNNSFTSVKEIAFKLGVDDSAHLGKWALKPYALVRVRARHRGRRRTGRRWREGRPLSRARRRARLHRFTRIDRRAGETRAQPRQLLRAEHRDH